ncbi:MAG: DUF2232 domain-containing protein [Pseudoramibacter sp.]
MKTKTIWEMILDGAIAGIIPALFTRMPVLIILYLFIPLLWVDLGRREGWKKTILPTAVAPAVMLLTRNPVLILTCTLYLALAGIGLAWVYQREVDGKRRIAFAYLAIFISVIGGMVFYQLVHHTAFMSVLVKNIEAFGKNLTASYKDQAMFTKAQSAQVASAIESMINQTELMLPSFFLIAPFFAAWLLVLICDRVVKRTRAVAKPLKPLSHWMMSKPLRNFLLVLLIVLLITQWAAGSGNHIYITTLNELTDACFSMMGLSFLYWVFNRKLPRESMGRKIIICLVLMIIPSSVMLLSLLGVIDVYTNLRLVIILRDSTRRR